MNTNEKDLDGEVVIHATIAVQREVGRRNIMALVEAFEDGDKIPVFFPALNLENAEPVSIMISKIGPKKFDISLTHEDRGEPRTRIRSSSLMD